MTKRGRPPGTKDRDNKSLSVWLAVELAQRERRRRAKNCPKYRACAHVAKTLWAHKMAMSAKHIETLHSQIEKRRVADPELAAKLASLLEFGERLSCLGPGTFVPTGFRSKRYESILGKFFSRDDWRHVWNERGRLVLKKIP